MDDVEASAKGGNDDTELMATSQQELNDDRQKGAQLVVTSKQQLIYGTIEETELVAPSRKEHNREAQEGAELVLAIQKELIKDTHEGIEPVAAFQKRLNDNPQKETQMLVTSQQELNDETREETELVAASRKELSDDAQEGAKLVVAIQKELVVDTRVRMELAAASQKGLDDSSQEGTHLVITSQQELIHETREEAELVVAPQKGLTEDTQEGIELVADSLKELNDNLQEGAQVVVASKDELSEDTEEGTDIVPVCQKELINTAQEGTELVVASQKELLEEPRELVVASQKELNDDPQDSTELLVASEQELSDEAQEGTELVAASHKEFRNDAQDGAEQGVASQKKLIYDTQEGIQRVVAIQQELSVHTQEGPQLGAASQKEPRNDSREGSELVVVEDAQGGTELVAASQKELIEDTQERTEVVAASQTEFNDNTQDETELVVASQQHLNGDIEGGTELVAASQKEQNNDRQEEAELVLAPQKELNSDSHEGIDLVAAPEKELNNDTQEGIQLVEIFQQEINDDTGEGTELLVASRKELIHYTHEKAELMAASHQEVNNDPQERPELLVTSQQEFNNEPKEGTDLVVASSKEVIYDPQGATKLVVACQKEPEEHGLTDKSANGTSTINNISLSNSLPKNVSEILSEQSVLDGNPTQGLVSRGRKMKWRDMARRKPHSPASTATEDRLAIQPAVAKKSKPRRNLPKRARSQGHSIPTRSPPSIASDAIQQVPIPHSSPNIDNNLQARYSSSPALAPFPTISPHRQQLPCTQGSPLRFDELLQATNSVAWRPVVDCDTPCESLGAAHCVHPPSASASVEATPLEGGGEVSFGVTSDDVAGLPIKARGRLGSEFPPFSSGKPPRPPSQSCSRDVNRSLPSDFNNLSIVHQDRRQTSFHTIPYPNEVNEPTTNDVDPHGRILPPLTCRQPETPTTSLSVRGFEHLPPANLQSSGPWSLSLLELDRPDNIDLPSTLPKRQKRNPGPTPQQKRRNLHKRRLQQLRTQVLKKLKVWGRESNLVQEADVVRQDNNDNKRLIISEEHRDAFVQNMVESCRKDPHMRATFLAAVKQIANLGVLHSSARLLMDSDSSGKSQEVFKASKGLSLEPEENSSAAVHLYKAVDELHKEGAMAMRKLPPVDDTMICSLGKTSDGAWELVFPNVGPRKRVRKQIDDGLDEPLRPSK